MSTHSNALSAAGRTDPERLLTTAPTVAGGRLRAMDRACRELPGVDCTQPAADDASELRIEVSDSGCGIAPEHRQWIFEPLFTTKPNGRDTGLGLSIASDNVRKHHGRREVESTPGAGSTFRIILPVHTPETAGLAET